MKKLMNIALLLTFLGSTVRAAEVVVSYARGGRLECVRAWNCVLAPGPRAPL